MSKKQTQKADAELAGAAAIEQKQFGKPVLWQMDITSAVILTATLQLALRHPTFAGTPTAAIVRGHCLRFKDSLPPALAATKRLIELGFDEKHDV